MLVCCLVCVLRHGRCTSLIGGVGMMICMSIVVILFAILLIAVSAIAFREAPSAMRDALCFLVMLIVCVAIVLVFVTKGF